MVLWVKQFQYIVLIRNIISFEFFIFLIGKRLLVGLLPLLVEFLNLAILHYEFDRLKSHRLDEIKVRIADEGPQQP
jgi:hypothetical protein